MKKAIAKKITAKKHVPMHYEQFKEEIQSRINGIKDFLKSVVPTPDVDKEEFDEEIKDSIELLAEVQEELFDVIGEYLDDQDE